MMIIRPGIPFVAADSRAPRGTVSAESLSASGIESVKTSAGEGDEAGIAYGQIVARELVMANAYPRLVPENRVDDAIPSC